MNIDVIANVIHNLTIQIEQERVGACKPYRLVDLARTVQYLSEAYTKLKEVELYERELNKENTLMDLN